MSYNDSSSLPGGAYLPLSVRGGDSNCNYYGYDSKGRTTSTFSGATANSAGSDTGGNLKTFLPSSGTSLSYLVVPVREDHHGRVG